MEKNDVDADAKKGEIFIILTNMDLGKAKNYDDT
jgi:hypothetical protein